MNEPTITIGLGLALVAGLLGLLRFFTVEIAQERRWREDADSRHGADLASFKLEAVRTFATDGAIEKAEERLAIVIDKMTTRLETCISRIETLSVEMARIAAKPNSHRGPSP